MVAYHDTEWGVPVRDDRRLFELLTLEGAQAGLSWRSVLVRRDGYRRAFADWDPAAVARLDTDAQAGLVADPGIIRNRAKVASAVTNAAAFLRVADEYGSFAAYLWERVEGRPILNAWESGGDVPVTTPLAEALSRDLRRRGFSFVGPTIVYAYLQATGVVMDHLTSCFRHGDLSKAAPGGRPCGGRLG